MTTVLELLELLYSESKEDMVSATSDRILQLQAEAATYRSLMRLIKRKPIALTTEE